MEHKEFVFKISKGMVNDFYVVSNLKPMGINDFDKPTRTIFCEARRFLKSKNKLSEKRYSFFEIESTISKESFLLIDDGWLPAAYPINQYNLIDRNLMSEIKRHITGSNSSFYGWLNLMKGFDKKYSVIFSALEKNFSTSKDRKQYFTDLFDDEKDIADFLSDESVFRIDSDFRNMAFDFMRERRSENIVKFLIESVPLIKNMYPKNKRYEVASKIFSLAKKYNVEKNKHPLILCLSVLYSENNNDYARKIVKPRGGDKIYTEKDAYNCINDTVFIDLIMLAKRRLNSDFCGITLDKNLAKYWCALNPKLLENQDALLSYSFNNYSKDLFNSASPKELKYIYENIGNI